MLPVLTRETGEKPMVTRIWNALDGPKDDFAEYFFDENGTLIEEKMEKVYE
ncbi:MAG: hypothetical protein ACTSYM_05300 [Candidatus Baldrarchaeia archaeon]